MAAQAERPATTGFTSSTRPATSHTNTTLRNAALRTLVLPKSVNVDEMQALSARSALKESRVLKQNLSTSKPGSARIPQPEYAALGEYRPKIQPVAKPDHCDNLEFQAMLAMIGEKCRQKFSKAREVFRFIDSDHSGSISRGEVHFFFRFFNVGQTQADRFFEGFDQDEEGEIAYVEFVKYLWPHVNPGNEQVHWSLKKDELAHLEKAKIPQQVFVTREEGVDVELPRDLVRAKVNISQRLNLKYKNSRDAFRELDYNRDGSISIEEMQHFFRLFGWEDVAERFYRVLETQGGGEVNFRTFAKMFSSVKESDLRLRL